MKKMILTFVVIFAGLTAVFMRRYTFGRADLQNTAAVQEKTGEESTAPDPNGSDDNDPDSRIVEMDESELGKKEKGKKYIKTDTDPDSIGVLVNRKYPLSSDYEPSDLTVPDVKFTFDYICEKRHMREIAAFYLERMFAAAEEEGVSLVGVSAYRSYSRQLSIYQNNVRTRGRKATDAVSAKPGASEHQTGLTIDISSASAGYAIDSSFGESDAGKWVARNCYRYGFIVRYPKGKEKITGYEYEPWHIRFTGRRLARYLTKNGITLEEYYADTEVKDKIHINKDIRRYKKQKAWAEAHATQTPLPSPTWRPTAAPVKTLVPVTETPDGRDQKKGKNNEENEKISSTKKPSSPKNRSDKDKKTGSADDANNDADAEDDDEDQTDTGSAATAAPADAGQTDNGTADGENGGADVQNETGGDIQSN